MRKSKNRTIQELLLGMPTDDASKLPKVLFRVIAFNQIDASTGSMGFWYFFHKRIGHGLFGVSVD